ncbi:MAG TPA: hypothetical protein VKI44_38740 [Acetobacteraceae bacterium]|nr:hypothetical protein [Acetobacteraceae bacterium]
MLNSHLRFTTVAGLLAISFWMMLLTNVATANDFMEKRECTLQLPTRAPVHTTCVVQGGISNGSLDVAVKTPDGKSYAMSGYLDKVDGWSLSRKRAKQTSQETGEFPVCVKTIDGTLELCLFHKVE